MEPIPKRRFNPVLFAEGGLKFTVRDDCPQSAAAAAGGEDQEKLDERYCMFEMEL
jgi:hypothetical protein